MSYKEELYQKYVSTHLQPRKGEANLANFRARARAYNQQLGNLLPTNKIARIADLGCGSGSIVWWLQARGYSNAMGVDISTEQVKVAHSLGVETVQQGNILDFLEEEKADFDVLIARDVIEHLDKETAFQFVVACRKKLKQGGVLILQMPNAESPFFGRIRYGDFTHEFALTPSSARQILFAAGFSTIHVQPARPPVTGIRSLLRYLVWRLIEPLIKGFIKIESPNNGEVVTLNLIVAAQVLS